MAVIGIGATYERDVSQDFVDRGVACVGWAEEDARPAHSILRATRIGDIVFIKSFAPSIGLTIKPVGIVTDNRVHPVEGLGVGIDVRWRWTGEERVGKVEDKWPVRSVTIYEEHHPAIQGKVINLLLGDGIL
jgi:hypothetical protein